MLFFSSIRAPLSSRTVLRTGGGRAASASSSSMGGISFNRSLALETSAERDFLLCMDPMEDWLITLFAIDLVSSASVSSVSIMSGTKSTTGPFSNASARRIALSLLK